MSVKPILQPGPNHAITIEPNSSRIGVTVAGRVVADTTRALRLQEAKYAPVDYIPIEDVDQTLLERTMVLYGSNLGDANAHSTTNLPTLFAGGGFRHGQHLAFDRERNYPLPNLFVSVLQRIGIPEGSFASGTSTMRGLDMI